jgi:hypothetical protein
MVAEAPLWGAVVIGGAAMYMIWVGSCPSIFRGVLRRVQGGWSGGDMAMERAI